jgi:2-oxoglutarate ferredoxin oxidoreductase subunit gamma
MEVVQMYNEIIFAGFGGQGVLLAGKLLSIAAMMEGKYVSLIPSYGAEMRGGTANCSVVISDEEVASPVVESPDICVILNEPSLLKFEPKIKTGGLLIYNSSLIDRKPLRNDIDVVPVDANSIALKNGSAKGVNMAAIGALIKKAASLVNFDSIKKALDKTVPERNKKYNPVNIAIIKDACNMVKGGKLWQGITGNFK